MESLDYWRLCDELTVVQAALLIVGEDPSVAHEYVEGWEIENRPVGYEAAKSAVSNALKNMDIEGNLVPIYERDSQGNVCGAIENTVDIHESMVSVVSLRKWLAARGVKVGFFFPEGADMPDYLDSSNPRYAPKLAAAVRAWLATEDPGLLGGKSPKQILMKWLREHAAEFGLADEDGKPNETGIEEVSKVANWRPTGGAPKTPG